MRRARLSLLVRRQRHLPEGDRSPAGGARSAGQSVAGRDRRPVPVAPAGPRQAERAGQRRAYRRTAGRAARDLLRGARAHGRGERRARARMVSEERGAEGRRGVGGPREPPGAAEPRQASLRRLRRYGIRPNRELGQNFLIGDNILGVIDRAAELGPDDVVLEVGGGLGVLSEYLAARVAHLHVVEVDRSLEPALRDALDPFANTTLHLGDAVRLDLAALDPAPTKVVANLPYGVAATVILRAVEELPGVGVQVAMVQREVGERLAARPGTAAYGAPSVLAQLACDVRVLRPVSRTVFHPVPNVDSVLIGLRRHSLGASPRLRALVQDGFAHRRKALAGGLALARGKAVREPVRATLAAMGLPEDARAERLSPAQWRELDERLAAAKGPGPR